MTNAVLKLVNLAHQWLLRKRDTEYLYPLTKVFEVCDHDFTRFCLIPTVLLHVNIPCTIDGSWYDGQVHIGLKGAVFEPCGMQLSYTTC